jgi:hypothetical protein
MGRMCEIYIQCDRRRSEERGKHTSYLGPFLSESRSAAPAKLATSPSPSVNWQGVSAHLSYLPASVGGRNPPALPPLGWTIDFDKTNVRRKDDELHIYTQNLDSIRYRSRKQLNKLLLAQGKPARWSSKQKAYTFE